MSSIEFVRTVLARHMKLMREKPSLMFAAVHEAQVSAFEAPPRELRG
jgi:hypothetical protein